MARRQKKDWFEKARDRIENEALHAKKRQYLSPLERSQWELATCARQSKLQGYREGLRGLEDAITLMVMEYPDHEVVSLLKKMLKQRQDEACF